MIVFRVLKWLLPCLVLPAAGLAFLLTTETGFRLLVAGCDSLAGPVFSVEQVEGSLLGPWRLKKVQVHVDGVVDLTLNELHYSWNAMALSVRELEVKSLIAQGLVVRLAENRDKQVDNSPLVLPNIHLPFSLSAKDVQVHAAEIYFPHSAEPLVVNECILQASVQNDQVVIERLMLDTPDYGGELKGKVQLSAAWPLTVSGNWRVADPGIGDLTGLLQAEGDLDTLEVSVEFKTPAVAEVQGQVTDILGDLHWQAAGKTEHFKLPDIQVDQPIDGTLTVVKASGTIKTYGGTLAADIHYHGYPQVQAHAKVDGDYNGLTIHSFSLLLEKARLTTRGKIGWTGGFFWQAEVEGKQLDPDRFADGWPGRIDTLLQSRGEWTAGSLTASLIIDRLQGELWGFPLTGSGRAGIDGKIFTVDALHLQSGSSFFQADGRVDNELDLTFKAGSDDLASLVPESSGQFQLQGTVNGSREFPHLAMTISGSDLTMKEYALQALKGEVDADLAVDGMIEADVEAGGIQLGRETISKARLQVQGNMKKHRAGLDIIGSPGTMQLVLAGEVQKRQWLGTISDLQLQTRQFGEWKMEKPVTLQMAEKNCAISELSLLQDQTRISLAGQWQQPEWKLHGEVDKFSLHLLKQWGVLSQQFNGVLDATIRAAGRGTVPDKAELTVSVPDLSLSVEDEDGESSTLHWTDNELQAQLEEGKASLTAKTLFQDSSEAGLELTVANCCDFTRPETMPITGKVDVNLKDLSPLAQLSDYMVQGKGRFAGSLALHGTVANPAFQGSMALIDGEIEIPEAGIAVQELELAVTGEPRTNRVGVTLVSEGNRLKAEGLVSRTRQQQWQVDVTIRGTDFQVVNISEYKATVSPDLHLVYGQDGTQLSGTVSVPIAKIAPARFEGSIAPSRDVVVIDADDEQEKKSLPLSLDVEVVMGKEVTVDAYGVKGNLNGSLKISQEPGQNITGLGSLNLRDGTFTYSGTTLKIKRGLVFYQGGPIDDPGLDVRADKEVDDKKVGIQLTGSASRMEMKLFSNPSMDDSNILSYLLFGHDMSKSNDEEGSMLGAAAATLSRGKGNSFLSNMEKETGLKVSLAGGEKSSDVSLVVGKQLSEDLYISYGKGLTDSEGVFKARYEMKHGLSVETETTSEATGADLFWSFER